MNKVLAALCLLAPSLAAAEATFYRPLSDETLSSARTKIATALAKDGKTGGMADVLLGIDAFATLNDDQCPGFTVDVLNATDRTLWAITVTVDQESGPTKKKSDVFHLPYLPAKSQATLSVACLENYSYSYSRYDYLGGGSSTITVDPFAESPRGQALQFAALAKQISDSELSSSTITKAASGSDTLLQVALKLSDPAITKELVAGIAATGFGTRELGQALATNEALATAVGEQLATLPAAQQAKLARALLASPAAEAWTEKLTPIIDKLCTGARPEVVALWAAAQGTKNIPVEALRSRVRGKCVLQATDAAPLVAALEAAPGFSGDAIDATDDKVFAAIVTQWKLEAKTDGVAGSHWAYIADTNNPARFDTAIAALPKEDLVDAISIVAAGKPSVESSPAAARKAAWIEATATSLGLNEQDELVRDLFTKLVKGDIADPAMRTAVRELKKLAPGAADGIVSSYANEHGKVYDSGRLVDQGIDSLDYLAFATESLGDCTSTLELLEACAERVTASKLPLVKAGDAALKADFKSSMKQLLYAASRERMVAASKTIAAAGWPTEVVVDKLCDDARDSINYNAGDLDETIDLVKQVPGGDVCIAQISDQASAKRRKVIIMTILALCGLILPMPLGGLWLKRKWKRLQDDLPKDKVLESTGPRLDDRLGAGGLGRALTSAISDARRDTSIAGLASIDAAAIERIAATVARAVKSGDAATLLAKLGGHALYVAALPVSDARPQLVARYLGAEWPAHLATIEASAGLPIVAIVVLCSPTAHDATLLVASKSSPPEALLDAREARELGANAFKARMSLTEMSSNQVRAGSVA